MTALAKSADGLSGPNSARKSDVPQRVQSEIDQTPFAHDDLGRSHHPVV